MFLVCYFFRVMKLLLSALIAASTNASVDWDVTAELDLEFNDEEQLELANSIVGHAPKVFDMVEEGEDIFNWLDNESEMPEFNFDDLTDTLQGRDTSDTDETTSESSVSDEGSDSAAVADAAIVVKPSQKRKRKSSSSVEGAGAQSESSAPRKRGRPGKVATTTTIKPIPVNMVGAPQYVPDDKPGRFVFRINPKNKTVNLVDTAAEAATEHRRKVRFAEENQVAYII